MPGAKGRSGRRPLPSAVKNLRGNAGKRPSNTAEPSPPKREPEMPKHLSSVAQHEWRRITPMLKQLGVLSEIDGKALGAYCAAFARWVEAETEISRYGIVIREPVLLQGEETGYFRHKKNPAVNISHEAMKLMKSFLVEFGMTPAARSRIRVEDSAAKRDPFDEFLAGASAKPGTTSVN